MVFYQWVHARCTLRKHCKNQSKPPSDGLCWLPEGCRKIQNGAKWKSPTGVSKGFVLVSSTILKVSAGSLSAVKSFWKRQGPSKWHIGPAWSLWSGQEKQEPYKWGTPTLNSQPAAPSPIDPIGALCVDSMVMFNGSFCPMTHYVWILYPLGYPGT